MRKTFLFLLYATFAGIAFATNCASTRLVSTDYKNGRVTLKLAWTGCDNSTHRNQVWVFVDYQEVRSGAPYGSWKPVSVTNVYSLSPVSVSSQTVTGNTRGVWITGSNGTTATVTLQLNKSTMPAQYKWCAFATDYPPNAVSYINGTYTLRGTKPFVINGTTVDSKVYSAGTVNTITDATGCPGWIERDVPTTSGTCKANLTLVGGYCRDLAADGATVYGSCNVEIKTSDAGAYAYSVNAGCPAGWRWPTVAEFKCFHPVLSGNSTWWVSGCNPDWLCGSNCAVVCTNYAVDWECGYGTAGSCVTAFVPSDARRVRCVR